MTCKIYDDDVRTYLPKSDWELLFEHFDKLDASKDHKKELEEEILWTEKHLKELKKELKNMKDNN